MRNLAILSVALASSACHGPSPAPRATSAEQDIALVERVEHQPAPLQPIRPEPVSFADANVPGREIIVPHSIARPRGGDGCGFFATGAPRAAVLVAVPQFGLVKHDGEWETFASDSGSNRVSGNLPIRYSSAKHTLQLADLQSGPDKLTIRDKYGRIVYASDGELRCKA